MKEASEALKAKREAGELEILDPLEKARRNPKSLRFAINGKCFDCEGGNSDPSIQWRIGNCVMPDCSLFPVRPYQDFKGRPTPKNLQF